MGSASSAELDGTDGPASTPFTWTRRHALTLAVLCLAALLDTIDATVVNVAMPTIRNALHFSEGGLAWMVNAYMVADIEIPSVVVGLGGGLILLATTIAAMSGVAAEHHGVASALLNVSRQLGGALGLAAISTVVVAVAARSAGPQPVALTAGFRAGFAVSAALVGLALVTALALLRDDGRGQRVNLVELQAG